MKRKKRREKYRKIVVLILILDRGSSGADMYFRIPHTDRSRSVEMSYYGERTITNWIEKDPACQ